MCWKIKRSLEIWTQLQVGAAGGRRARILSGGVANVAEEYVQNRDISKGRSGGKENTRMTMMKVGLNARVAMSTQQLIAIT